MMLHVGVQVFHRMHMVFGILFLLFALMHDIKLWTYTVPGVLLFLCFGWRSCMAAAFATLVVL